MRKVLAACFAALSITIALKDAGAQHRESPIKLRPPDYSDATSVGRHIAYSLILANLINASRDKGTLRNCYFQSAMIDFPGWWLLGESEVSWQTCHENIKRRLAAGNFTQPEVDDAATRALQHFRAVEVRAEWHSRFPYQALLLRLGAFGDLALRKLYPSDSVLIPLSRFDEWLRREANADRFNVWLAEQLASTDRDAAEQSKRFPIRARPEIDYTSGITIKSGNPELSGRRLILVRCDTNRDWNCIGKAPENQFCGLTKEEIIAGKPAYRSRPPLALSCMSIGHIIAMPGFQVFDAPDPDFVTWVYEQMQRRRQSQPNSLVEHIVLVTVD